MSSAVDWSNRLAARTATGGGEITAILSLADAGDVITFSGGFPAPETFPTALLREPADDLLPAPAAAGARRRGVAYVPGAPFYPDGRGHDQLRLSFSRASEPQIEEGVRRLAGLFGHQRGDPE